MNVLEAPVVIAGAGPVGLSLALGLAHHGVRSIVCEAQSEIPSASRALGVLPRTLEIFRAWGVLPDFLARGTFLTQVRIHTPGRTDPLVEFNLGVLAAHTAHPGLLVLEQSGTTGLLLDAVSATGLVEVRFDCAVSAFRDDGELVTVQAAPGSGEPCELHCRYLAGCDGAHSVIRRQLGWELEGKTYPARIGLVDIKLADERDRLPWPRVAAVGESGVVALRFGEGAWRLIVPIPPAVSDETALDPIAVEQIVEHVLGPGPFTTTWSSVSRIHCRTSPHFRWGRVFLAGDAAHINSPAGGQGMNSGIQDAHNLSWKLPRLLTGGSPDLAVSYEQERRGAILGNVDRYTDLLTRAVLQAHPLARRAAMVAGRIAIGNPTVFAQVAQRAAMLDTHYEHSVLLHGTDPLLGRRAPDGELLSTEGQSVRLLDLAGRDAALLLFDDGRLPTWNVAEIGDLLTNVEHLRVARILASDARADTGFRDVSGGGWSAWHATGETAALVRPDGHVGWIARRPTIAALQDGVTRALGARV